MSWISLTLTLLFNLMLLPHDLPTNTNLTGLTFTEPHRIDARNAFATAARKADFDCATVNQIPISECAALIDLYQSTNGDNWLNNEGWLQTDQPCAWNGVLCDGTEHVIRIFLQQNQLSGSIPPTFGDLSQLKWIQLFGNQLSGPIPAELGKLDQVTWLRLEENELSGTIPPELGAMSALENLYLSDNPLTGAIPPELGDLPTLYRLYLSDTQLSGSIPPQLGNLLTLEFLLLNETALSGPLPSSFTRLENLNFFHIQRTGLCEPSDQAFQLWLADIDSLYNDKISCTDSPPISVSPQPLAQEVVITDSFSTNSLSTNSLSTNRIPTESVPVNSVSISWAISGILVLVTLTIGAILYGWWIGQRQKN